MRPKVVILVLVLAVLVFGTLFTIRQSTSLSARRAQTPSTVSSASQTHETLISAAKSVEPAVLPATNAVQRNTEATDSFEDAHKTYVEQRSSQLMEMAMNDDRASLDTIL